MSTLHLRNPHSVLAALAKRPKDVLQIVAPPGALDRESEASSKDAWAKVVSVARERGVQVTQSGGGPKNSAPGKHQGRPGARPQHGQGPQNHGQEAGRVSAAEALVKELPGLSSEELFRGAKDRAGGKGLWLALDCLTDPQNVGAIFRSASFFGVQGILLTQERSAPLTSAVYDVATGGLEHVPFAIQPNLQRAFEVAKEAGLWILGTSEHAKQSFRKVERDRPWLLVLGNEEKGMRRLTEESCDVVCQVPPQGGVTSLNVSVAAGVLISALSG
jgi:23S rRNA (guanosine2251-2'-O)-methyltransferase